MMWKWCVLLVMLFAWRASSAQLVNLLEPNHGYAAPKPWPYNAEEQWVLFDYDKSTYYAVRRNYYPYGVEFKTGHDYPIRPTKYRIIMAAHVPSAEYPSSWKVTGEDAEHSLDVNPITLDQVTGAVFKNGVYEGTLRKRIDMEGFYIKFDQKSVTIAEVEMLGPRSALDALWPYGDYPCSQRLAITTNRNGRGPKTIFYKAKNVVSRSYLRYIFHANGSPDAEFDFDGAKPVIIGAKLAGLPMVQQVSMDVSDDYSYDYPGIGFKMILQGNLCENDHCHKFGSKGWVKLGRARVARIWGWRDKGVRIFVKNPGEYKAYRVKFFPEPGARGMIVNSIYFLGCPA